MADLGCELRPLDPQLLQMTNFGPPADIAATRSQLAEELHRLRADYQAANRARDVWGIGPWVSMLLALVAAAWLLRFFTDFCAPMFDVCYRTSQLASFVYSSAIIIGIGIFFASGSGPGPKIQAIRAAVSALIQAVRAGAAAGAVAGAAGSGGSNAGGSGSSSSASTAGSGVTGTAAALGSALMRAASEAAVANAAAQNRAQNR